MLLDEVPPATWPLSTRSGALAHVMKVWGPHLIEYRSIGSLAVGEALVLWDMRARCARLSTLDREIAMTVQRKYGRETIFQQALYEAAGLDPHLARVITPNTAMLLCVAEGVMEAPRDEDQRITFERRWSERARGLRAPRQRSQKHRTRPAVTGSDEA